MLSIDWRRLPDLGRGFQNSDGGWVSADEVVTAFGHGPALPHDPSSAFLNSASLLNVTAAAGTQCRGRGVGCGARGARWLELPAAPVSGRQDVASAVIDGSVFVLGGFSYSAPYSFSDFLKLSRRGNGSWAWSSLPPFPYPVSMHAVASIGSQLYVQGGADYNRKEFCNWADCGGGTPGLGKRLYVFDTAQAGAEWQRLPDCPGPPKANAALSSVGGALYAIGGMSFVPTTGSHKLSAMTLVDNWRYEPASRLWTRLVDLPVASGNFQTNGARSSFEDRYIVLLGAGLLVTSTPRATENSKFW